jgi:hypothetical protein
MGVAAGDYDNDSWPDLFVTNVNGNQLFHDNRMAVRNECHQGEIILRGHL